jgi:hypothetical protein
MVDLLLSVPAVAGAVGAVVAGGSLGAAVWDRRTQYAFERRKTLYALWGKWRSTEVFRRICDELESGSSDFSGFAQQDLYDYVASFEEVASYVRDGLIPEVDAWNTFGFYAIFVYDSSGFRAEVDVDGLYWAEFAWFAERMQIVQERMKEAHKRRRRK